MADDWIYNKYVPSYPTFTSMAITEATAIYLRTKASKDKDSTCLWTMVYSPTQQALCLDPRLYVVTVYWRNNREFELYVWLEPVWSAAEIGNKRTIRHFG